MLNYKTIHTPDNFNFIGSFDEVFLEFFDNEYQKQNRSYSGEIIVSKKLSTSLKDVLRSSYFFGRDFGFDLRNRIPNISKFHFFKKDDFLKIWKKYNSNKYIGQKAFCLTETSDMFLLFDGGAEHILKRANHELSTTDLTEPILFVF